MCDYSLAALRTRLAIEGEELITYRFPTGTLGLTSPVELGRYKQELRGWRSWFNPREVPCAVCIPPYARLLLRDIPERLQRELGVRTAEEVVLIQMSDMPGRHRDGVRFKNNQEVLLQHLAEGQRADVLSLSSLSETESNALDHARVATA
jgi:hypothetical protein